MFLVVNQCKNVPQIYRSLNYFNPCKNAPQIYRSLKYLTQYLYFLLGFSLLIGCQSQESLDSHSNSKLKKMTLILDWYPSPNHIPIYTGLQKGIFAKHGIDLIIKKPHDFPEIPSLISSGLADFALYTMPHTILSATRGNDITVAAILIPSPTNGFYHLKQNGGCCLGHYDGKTFASTYHFLSRATGPIIEKSHHIKFHDKQKLRCDVLTALVTDSASLVSGALYNIEGENWKYHGIDVCYHSFEDLGIPSYCELVFLANRKSEVEIRWFREAIAECITYCRENPEESFTCYLGYQSHKSKKTIDWERKAWKVTLPLLAEQQTLDRNQWERFYSWMKSEKLINQDVNVNLDLLLTF